jgi:alpha-L-arabinofuranosidase
LELNGAKKISRQALKTVPAGEAAAVNGFDAPSRAAPVTSGIQVDRQFEYEAPAHSLTVLRIETR